MLIIAIPKSASSALINTMSNKYHIPDRTSYFRTKFFSDLFFSQEYKILQSLHHEIQDFSEHIINEIDSKDHIVKYHIPPTALNQELLKHKKKVILLRSPESIIESYYRGDSTGIYPIQSIHFLFCFSKASWVKRAKRSGLYDELVSFIRGWEEHDGDSHIIWYDDVISDIHSTLLSVETYFNLSKEKSPTDVVLAQKKYSRNVTAQHVCYRFIRHILFLSKYITRRLIQLLHIYPYYRKIKLKRKMNSYNI